MPFLVNTPENFKYVVLLERIMGIYSLIAPKGYNTPGNLKCVVLPGEGMANFLTD